MGIAILPYEMKSRRLADIPQRELLWPLETGERSGLVRDLTADDHLVVSPSSRRLYLPAERLRCHLSLRITEPYAVHRRHYLAMYALWPRFFRIYSRCRKLARRLPNARALTLTSTWIDDPQSVPTEKKRHMSLIASAKRQLPGHRLRHEIADWIAESGNQVDLLGRAHRPIELKQDGLAPYRFSVVIENCREPGYFSEKLMDCLLCRTVPIYWGAPDIAEFFNVEGMIICENAKDIRHAVASLGQGDYERLALYMEENFQRALSYRNQEKAIAHLLQHEVGNLKAA